MRRWCFGLIINKNKTLETKLIGMCFLLRHQLNLYPYELYTIVHLFIKDSQTTFS